MQKKRAILTGILILVIILLSSFVTAIGCCVSQSGCFEEEQTTCEASADSSFYSKECSELPECNVVCCVIGSETIDARHEIACPSPYISYFNFDYTAFPAVWKDECMNCVEDLKTLCSDGNEIITAQCKSGKYLFTGLKCKSDTPQTEKDTDGDGIPDVDDLCPYDKSLEKPEGQSENEDFNGVKHEEWCADLKDNDCDGLFDSADKDCEGACITGEKITHSCDDGTIITIRECINGKWVERYGSCPEEAVIPEGFCGDGIVQTPNSGWMQEQCDGDISKGASSQVNADSYCGKGGTCKLFSTPKYPNPDCTCVYSCDQPTDSFQYINVIANPDSENPNNIITWKISSSECNIVGFTVKYCLAYGDQTCNNPNILAGEWYGKTGESWSFHNLQGSSFMVNHSIPKIEEDTHYCYRIITEYEGNGATVESSVICSNTGDPECLQHPGSWCSDDKTKRHYCEFGKVMEEICAPTDFCSQTTEDYAECKELPKCQKCNQLFQMFGMGALGRLVCQDEDCSIDGSKTNADMFYPCGGEKENAITECYDYTSKEACENENDKCNLNCEWESSPEAYESFGIGVCKPISSLQEKCEYCQNLDDNVPASLLFNNTKFNRVFHWCTPSLCNLYGEGCIMTTGTDGDCRNGATLGCRVYGTDYSLCGNGNLVDVDVSYDSESRTGITNKIKKQSNDLFHFGLCSFDSEEGGCFKDVDGNGEPDCGDYDSYSSFDWECERDMIPPISSIDTTNAPKSNRKPLLSKYVDLPVEISESGKTYFCFDENNCYPSERTMCRIQKIFDEGEYGGWDGSPIKLFYYTEDNNKNLEEVQSIDVMLDTVSPTMEVTVSEQLTPVMEITLTSQNPSDVVVCDAWLETEEGIRMTSSPTSPYPADINSERGIEFHRNFYNLRDDIYYFKYSCADLAGNIAEGKEKINVDTNRLHSPLPEGILSEKPGRISITTESKAEECRYSPVKGTSQPDYNNMHIMNTDDGLYYYVDLTVVPEDLFQIYDIKCKFEDGVQGEKNDRVKFSIDTSGPMLVPSSSMDGSVDFNPELSYSGQQTIYIHCRDEEGNPNSVYSASGVHNFDFGCSHADYTIDGVTYNAESFPIGPLNIEEGTTITYDAYDNNGNLYSGQISVDIDENGPDAIVEIIPLLDPRVLAESNSEGFQSPPVQNVILGVGSYKIRVRASSIIQSAEAIYTVPDENIVHSLYQLDSTRLTEKEFQLDISKIKSNNPKNASVEVIVRKAKPGAQCTVDTFNLETVPTIVTLNFSIDTFMPDITLNPLLDGVETAISGSSTGFYDFKTPDQEYKLYRYNEKTATGTSYSVYYTNQPDLFITGFVNPDHISRTESIKFFSAPAGNPGQLTEPKSEYILKNRNSPIGEMSAPPSTCIIGGVSEKGTTRRIPVICTGGWGELTSKKYISFEHDLYNDPSGYNLYSGIDRLSYGNFGAFYEITSENQFEGYIELDNLIEADILPETEWNLFSKKYPSNWFGDSLYLIEGANKVYFMPIADNGAAGTVNGDSYKVFDIVLDTAPPQLVKSTPRPGSTNKDINTLFFEIKEVKSGGALLDEGSVKILVNGNPVDYEITTEDEGLIKRYYINHTQSDPFPNGEYNIQLIGKDKAGNELVEEGGRLNFTFVKDDGFPDEPVWDFKNSYFLEEKSQWFSNNYPSFTLDFTSNDILIEIERLFKLSADEMPPGTQVPFINCMNNSENYYDCSFTFTDENQGSDRLYMNNAYELIIEAFKKYPYPEEPGPTAQFYSDMLILDNVPPSIEQIDHKDVIAMGRNLTFYMIIPVEKYDLNVTMFYQGDGKTYNLIETGNDHKGHYTFVWMVPQTYDKQKMPWLEDPKDITISVKDYAGNGPATITRSIRLDLTPPDADSFVFKPLVPFNESESHPPKYYTNNCTVDIVGSFKEEDMDSIVILPGTWNKNIQSNEIIGSAHINQGTNSYSIQITLKGEENQSILTDYQIVAEDEAGNTMTKKFQLFCDLKPPEQPQIVVK